MTASAAAAAAWRMRTVVLLWLVFMSGTAPLTSSSSSSTVVTTTTGTATVTTNDGYCDDQAGGSDETNSSACSFFAAVAAARGASAVFTCTSADAFGAPSVHPLSRVHDGVCDCCDGSDEAGSPFPTQCDNVCGDAEMAVKQAALVRHRNVQAGLRAKRDITVPFFAEKAREQKGYEELKKERELLKNMIGEMKYFLAREEGPETVTRWRLIREREHRCALGMLESCDLFHPVYLPTDEIVFEGFPEEFALAKAKLRFNKDGPEKRYLNSQRGLERVRNALCEAKYMLPDENARVFIMVAEYLRYVTSPQGEKTYWERTPVQKRKNTLFSRFLDDGARGHVLAAIVPLEALGLLLAPATVLLDAVGRALGRVVARFLDASTLCAASDADSAYAHTLGLTLWAAVRPVCEVVAQAQVEGSVVSDVLNRLDPFSYSGVTAITDRLQPFTSTVRWVVSIMWGAPHLYYSVYWKERHRALPPRRHACLMRYGIEAARTELSNVDRKIATEEHVRKVKAEAEAKAQARAEAQRARGIDPTNTQAANRKRDAAAAAAAENEAAAASAAATSAATSAATAAGRTPGGFQYIDFGLDGSWEAVKDKCVEKQVGEYKYSLCLFGHAKQNHVLIGKFSEWGVLNTPPSARPPREDPSYFSAQVYSQGALCVGAAAERGQERPKRTAQVHFTCAPNFEIVDVVEGERCVYTMAVNTPLACLDEMEAESTRQLEQLGVFGFVPGAAAAKEVTVDGTHVG